MAGDCTSQFALGVNGEILKQLRPNLGPASTRPSIYLAISHRLEIDITV